MDSNEIFTQDIIEDSEETESDTQSQSLLTPHSPPPSPKPEIQTQLQEDDPLDTSNFVSQKYIPLTPDDNATSSIITAKPTYNNSSFLRSLPFKPNPHLDPRAAAALLGSEALLMSNFLGDVYQSSIQAIFVDLNDSEIKDFLKSPKTIKDFKFNTLRSLIEFSRASFVSDAIKTIANSRFCFGFIKQQLDLDEFDIDEGIYHKHCFSDKFITTLSGMSFLPTLMALDDHKALLDVIINMESNIPYRHSCFCCLKKRKT